MGDFHFLCRLISTGMRASTMLEKENAIFVTSGLVAVSREAAAQIESSESTIESIVELVGSQ